jgi:hypothetical protein
LILLISLVKDNSNHGGMRAGVSFEHPASDGHSSRCFGLMRRRKVRRAERNRSAQD